MHRTLRPQSVLATLAAILAGLALAATAVSVVANDPASPVEMPGSGCPPMC